MKIIIGLYKKADTDEMTYSISPYSENSAEILEFYKFTGKLVGKALFESIPINAHLDHCFLKQIISSPITLDDILNFDKQVRIIVMNHY